MANFKFLHAADLHLDSPLAGLSNYEGLPADEIRLATRKALSSLIATAIENEVSFVIIAGDAFDGDWRDMSTGLFFIAQMAKLSQAGISVYLIDGNHDAESVVSRKLQYPPNVHHFDSKKPRTVKHEATGTMLHGQSFKTKELFDNLAINYPAAVPGAFNIGILHTSLLGGYGKHLNYAPCNVEELRAKGYSYWALGHIHDFSIVATDPWIVFSGNIQGRHANEGGAKGAVLVEVEDNQIVGTPKRIFLDSFRWEYVTIDLMDVQDNSGFSLAVLGAFNNLTIYDGRQADARILRIELHGETQYHSRLVTERDQIRDEILALAAGFGKNIFIEKVRIRTQPVKTEVTSSQESAAGGIIQMLAANLSDQNLLTEMRDVVLPLISKMPSEVVASDDFLASLRTGDIQSVLNEALPALVARLSNVGI